MGHCDDHPAPGAPPISNMAHQHAFTLLGREAFFGVHMTQYHTEMHKYQLVLRLSLPEDATERLRRLRQDFPRDLFVLANDDSDEFNIPALASGRRKTFTGNVFQGLPPFGPDAETDPHFFPWALKTVRPAIGPVTVTVERIVTFRPFAHDFALPPAATYLMFGEGREAHLTNLQTAQAAPGPEGGLLFGPDYDHVLSLREAPDWIAADMLEAGIVVAIPSVPLRDPHTGAPAIPCGVPIAEGEALVLNYRALPRDPALTAIAGPSLFCATAVCNSPGLDVCPPDSGIHASPTPPEYLVAHP